MEASHISKEILKHEEDLQLKLHKACLQEEEYWRLRSRSLRLQAGDRNTVFFHKKAQATRSQNVIMEIQEDFHTHTEFPSIKEAAYNHFKNIYSKQEDLLQHLDFLEMIPQKVTSKMNQCLIAPVRRK